MSDSKAKLSKKQYMIALLTGLGYTGTCGVCYAAMSNYAVYQTATGFTDTQMGSIITIMTAFAIVSALGGGILADIVNPKWCLLFSYVASSALSLLMITYPGFNVTYIIAGMLGITCLMPKWYPMSKLLNNSGTSEQVGRIWGWFTAFTGGSTFLIGLVASAVLVNNDARRGFSLMVILYVVTLAISAVLTLILLPNKWEVSKTNSFKLKYIVNILTDPMQYLTWLIFLGTYVAYYLFTYFSPMLQNLFLFPLASLTLFNTIRSQGVKTVGGPLFGTLRDKIGTTKFYYMAYLLMAASMVGLFLTPWNAGGLIPALIFMLLIGIAYQGTYSIYATLTPMIGTPVEYQGTAFGLMNVAEGLSGMFIAKYCANALTKSDPVQSYRSIFGLGFTYIAVGFIALVVLTNLMKKRKNQQQTNEA